VIGVIVAFADLAEGSSKVQMDKVMGGIAEALVATAVGLFVAIPAVVAYNVFQKMIGDVEDNLSSIKQRLCALLATVGTFGEAPERAAATAGERSRADEPAAEMPSGASLPEPVGAEE
ncbi:MAG: MotA/TolQ/ExbB proton channel family protein, partial [Polyangiaceae bacterium]